MDEPSVFGFFFFVPDFLFFWPTPGSVFTKPPHGRQLARRVWRAPRGGAHPAAKQRRTDCHRQFNNSTGRSLCECGSFHHTLGIDKDQAARCDCERQNQQVPPREGHGGRRKARNSESMENSPYASRISIRVVPQENQIASVLQGWKPRQHFPRSSITLLSPSPCPSLRAKHGPTREPLLGLPVSFQRFVHMLAVNCFDRARHSHLALGLSHCWPGHCDDTL